MIISVQIFLGKSICFNQRRVHKTLEHKKVPFVFSETFKMDVLSSNSMWCLLTLIPHSFRLQTFAYMTSFSRLKAWGELRKRVDGILKFWVGRPVSDGSPFWQEKWQGARLNLPSLGLARLFFPSSFSWCRACETSQTAAHNLCSRGLWVGQLLGPKQKHTQMQEDLHYLWRDSRCR